MPDRPDRPGSVAPFRLRADRAVPAGWPPDVVPNEVIASADINRIKASVYDWPGDVDGHNHILRNVNLQGVTGVLTDPTTTAGDLIVRDAAALGRLGAGADGQVLTADSTQPQKLKWSNAPGAVASVFGRAGAVVAQAGDYTAAQVSNAVDQTATYANPGWITSIGWLKIINTPAAYPPSAHTHDAADIVTGRVQAARLGAGVADSSVFLRGDGVWAAAGGSGGSVIDVFGRAGHVVAQAGDYTAAQVTGAVVDPTTAVGDLLVRASSGIGRLPAGSGGQVLTVDLGQPLGIKWAPPAVGSQTPWTSDINAAGFKLLNAGRVGVGVDAPAYGVDVAGDVNCTGQFRVNGLPFAASQTPWLSDIDGGGHGLSNVSAINLAGPFSKSTASNVGVRWQTNDATPLVGQMLLCGDPALANRRLAISALDSSWGWHNITLAESGGQVGIGTATPATEAAMARLVVTGQAGQTVSNITESNTRALVSFRPDANSPVTLAVSIESSTGQPAIQSVTWNGGGGAGAFLINPFGGSVGVGKIGPQYRLDIAGDVNCSGVYRVNGTPISAGGGAITTQSVVTASRAAGTVYQNASGKPMFVCAVFTLPSLANAFGYTDATTSPAANVSAASNPTGTGTYASLAFWVLPGNYYKITSSSGTLSTWTEWT